MLESSPINIVIFIQIPSLINGPPHIKDLSSFTCPSPRREKTHPKPRKELLPLKNPPLTVIEKTQSDSIEYFYPDFTFKHHRSDSKQEKYHRKKYHRRYRTMENLIGRKDRQLNTSIPISTLVNHTPEYIRQRTFPYSDASLAITKQVRFDFKTEKAQIGFSPIGVKNTSSSQSFG